MTNTADLLITNARVHTMEAEFPYADTVAVRGHRIVFVGHADDAAGLRARHTRVMDGAGATLLPGFIDSHFHLLLGSLELDGLQLDQARDLDHLRALLQAHAAASPDKPWIRGVQLRYHLVTPERPLDRHFLDAVSTERPIFLLAFDGHTAWANTRALDLAGLLHGRQTAPGSEIVMDARSGTATGELREPDAYDLVRNLIPPPTPTRTRALVRQGMARAAALGITSVHNMDGDQAQMELYSAMQADGELTLRLYMPYSFKPQMELDAVAEAAEWARCYQGSYLRAGALKLFVDGVLESYTALMLEGYAGRPENQGAALYSADRVKQIAAAADKVGLQMAIHACGDGAVRRALDAFAHARTENGPRDSRHRVEHVELIHPADLPRFAELGAVASMQPLHAPLRADDDDVWPERPGRARWPHSFAWESLRRAGAHLAYGSDWPVVSMNPLLGIHAGRNRQPWQPRDPDQRQSVTRLLAGYTRDAAYAEFQEAEKGRIRPGMLADLVLLDRDLLATPEGEIDQVWPVLTVCDGRIVFE